MFSWCGKHLVALKAAQGEHRRPHGFPTVVFLPVAQTRPRKGAGSHRELRSCSGRGWTRRRVCCHDDCFIRADNFSWIQDEAKTS